MTETNDPFGGMDMSALLQQAQQMQQQLVAAQQELAETSVDGTAGGGAVTVAVSGAGELTDVRFDAANVDTDDLDSLGDLVVAAYRDAKTKADALAAETLGPFAGQLGGPGV